MIFHPCQVCSKSILSLYTLCITCLSDKASKEAKKLTKESCPTCGSTDVPAACLNVFFLWGDLFMQMGRVCWDETSGGRAENGWEKS